MKKQNLKQVYKFMTEEDHCLCPVCKADRLAFITENEMKLSYKKLRKTYNEDNNLFDQIIFKRVECLNCHERFFIDCMAKPPAYYWTWRNKK